MQKPASPLQIALFIILLSFTSLCLNITGFSQQVHNPDRGLRIAFLTDIHVSPGAVSEPNLENIVSEINEGDYDFAVVTGDVTNTGVDTELVTVHRILGHLKIPLHIVPGNHETNWSESACQTFPRLWGDDRCFFSAGNYLFIGFDTGPFMKMGDGHVKEEDVRWIRQTLAREAGHGKTVVSMSHYPLGDGLDNWYEVTEILKQYNTRLVLCGHGHRLSLHNFDGLPGVMGRAALTGGSDVPGYNILTLRHDSASIFTGVLPVDKHMIVYGNSRGQVIALDPVTKKALWKNQYGGSIYSTPVYGKGIVAFSTVDGLIHGLDIRTGQLKWKWDNGKAQRFYSPGNTVPAIAAGKVFLVAPDRYMTAIDPASGKTLWRDNSRHVRESMGISADGRQVYAKLMNDTIIAVSTRTDSFHLVWEANARFGYEHNPCPILESNGVVYAGTKNGIFVAADAATGNILMEHKAGNSSINEITADKDGNIWISLIEGSIQQYQSLTIHPHTNSTSTGKN